MSRKFAEAFYHSTEWKKVREFVLMRDRYKFRLSPENIWDPKITLNPDNLISLCKDCHFEEHKVEKVTGSLKAHGKEYGDCREGYHFDENGMLVPDSNQAKSHVV